MADPADPFVPEADALEQSRTVDPAAERPDDDNDDDAGGRRHRPALDIPERLPMEAPEADTLEQNQTIDFDDEE